MYIWNSLDNGLKSIAVTLLKDKLLTLYHFIHFLFKYTEQNLPIRKAYKHTGISFPKCIPHTTNIHAQLHIPFYKRIDFIFTLKIEGHERKLN